MELELQHKNSYDFFVQQLRILQLQKFFSYEIQFIQTIIIITTMAIQTLKDLKLETKEEYYNIMIGVEIPDFNFELPFDDFDEFGLKFNPEYLEKIHLTNILYPLEIMSDFADIITKKNIDNRDEETISKYKELDFDLKKDYSSLNATGIGNLSYSFLYCEDDVLKAKCEDILNQIHKHVKTKLMIAINDMV